LKNNLDYYQHFSDAHNHAKFKTLRVKYGWEGEGKFWALNNIIAKAENCKLDLSVDYNKASLANDLDFSLEDFEEFICYLLEKCHLIKKNGEKITTNILQENLKKVMNDREQAKNRRVSKSKPENKIEIDKKTSENVGERRRRTPDENHKVKESKVKESKVKESKVKEREKEINTILLFYKKLTLKTKMSKVPGEVNQRIDEGCTVLEAKFVILYKYLEWWDNPKMKNAVNLTTLFRPCHFEEYLSQAEQGLDELINRRYKRFKKHWYDDNMNKPLEERKKLKLLDFKEYRQKMLGEILEVGNGEPSPKTAT